MQELYQILALSLALGTVIAASHPTLAEIENEQKREASNHHELMGKFAEMEEHLDYNRDKRCTGHYDSTATRKFVNFRAKQLLKLMREIEVNQHKLEKWQLKWGKQLCSLVGPNGSMTDDVAELKDFCGLDKSNSHVKFKFVAQDVTTIRGQDVYVVGNAPELGSWDTKKAVKLSLSVFTIICTRIILTTVRNKVARSSVWEERPLFARVDVYQNFNSYQDRPHVQTYFIFRTFETYSSQFRVGSRS
jgi:hypothetical protein